MQLFPCWFLLAPVQITLLDFENDDSDDQGRPDGDLDCCHFEGGNEIFVRRPKAFEINLFL